MTILDNFTNPMDQFNMQSYVDIQQELHNKLHRQTNGRKLGNNYHKKLGQMVDAYDIYDKLMSRVIDNPKYAVRDVASGEPEVA